MDSVQASVTQVSRARVRLLVQGTGFFSAITDDLDRLDAPSQVNLVAEGGSAAVGLRARLRLPNGIMLLGGFSGGREDYQDVTVGDELTGTLAIRYAPALGPSRPFVEIGGLYGGSDNVSLRRHYLDGIKTVTGQGSAAYRVSAVWGRAGWIWDPSPADQIGVYGEYGLQRQTIGAYLEPLSNLNPFEALVAPGLDKMDVGKLGVRASHAFAGGWEMQGGLAVAHAFYGVQNLGVVIDGIGPVAAPPAGQQTWVEYRVRLGRAISHSSAISVFVAGIAGTATVGDAEHVGVDYRIVF